MKGNTGYFEYDRSSRFLFQNPRQAQWLQVRVGVVDETRVVVSEQSLDVVEDEAELIHMFNRLLLCDVICLQRGGEAADGGCVHDFAHLEKNGIKLDMAVQYSSMCT